MFKHMKFNLAESIRSLGEIHIFAADSSTLNLFMNKSLLMTVVMFMTISCAFAQHRNYWTRSSPEHATPSAEGRAMPTSFEVFQLDLEGLKQGISMAPVRGLSSFSQDFIISFPTPEGGFQRYRVVEASVLHPDLAARFPGIKSYAGQGVDDPSSTIRFSISNQRGFHGMVLSPGRSFYIDPYSDDLKYYTIYNREDLRGKSDFTCYTDEGDGRSSSGREGVSYGRTDDKKLRKYRLALSCNAEYGNIFAGSTGTDAEKKGRILAQMNITMTRVNGIYERDLAITMEIIPTNDRIIYYGSTTTDPWGTEYNTKTQQVIDSQIGNANYDIGHNFNTSGGGNAGCIGCVCTTGSKGSGYTGRSDPTGDAFDIDYVAHEMGHQFGGYHTQSNSSCRSGSGTTEVEPGSGSTIMGYAGICAANVQNNSDAYFAYVNIRDISANVQTGTSSSCAQVIALANNAPTANAGLDYTIPKSTPFALTGSGSDPDGDALTYTWEQNDPGNPNSNSAPTSTRTIGPMFRSRQGTSSPTRVFPQMSDVVANNLAPTWEVIPSVARTLNFSLTVRDNKAGGGQTSDDLMKVTVSGTAGPFVITAPNTAVTWAAGSSQTVTWNVASTNVTPVNCLNVNIKLSTDGGFTYPITLVSNTPNDGSQAVTIPNNPGTTCRIKVEAADNIFFDISNTNFTIGGAVTCNATVPTGLAATNITSGGATLNWTSVSGATYDVQYRVVGTTTWTTVAASSNTVNLSGLTAATQYEAQVRSKCSSTTSAYSSSATFTTTGTTCTATVPTGLNATNVSASSATLAWTAVTGTTYDVQYRVVGTATWTTVAASTNSTSLSGLTAGTQYEAQVRSKCATTTSAYSASVTFTTTTTQITYCASKGNSVADEWLARVQLGTINNASGANAGYGNFVALSTDLAKGASHTITITPAWAASKYNEGYAVWIDYNKDGDFADAGEQVMSRAASQTTPVSASFTVPATAITGATRMRVSMKYNAIPTACETFSYGEVEDYTVNLTTATTTCTNVTLTLKLDNYPEETSWIIKNASGATVASGGTYGSSPDGSTITATNCLASGCYTFTISDVYGDGICCTYGNGSYVLKDAAGTTLVSGSSFTSSATHNFCVGGASKDGRGDNFEEVFMTTETNKRMISPNPVKDILKVSLKEKADIISVSVTAINGKVINVVAHDNKEINVASLPAGFYILSVETTKGIVREKFVKE